MDLILNHKIRQVTLDFQQDYVQLLHLRVDRCCYVLFSIQLCERAWEHWGKSSTAQNNGAKDAYAKSRELSEIEDAFEETLDPKAGSPTTGKCVTEFDFYLWMISL